MLYLLVYKIKELLPSHPSRQQSDKRHVDQEHTVRSFIEHSLMHSEMIMLGIIIASQRKSSDCLLKYIIAHLPTLIFVEFVNHFYDTCLSIWKILYLCNFTKNPSFLWMLTIDQHLFFYLLIIYFPFGVKMALNKARKISNKLVDIDLICFSHLKRF